MNGELLAVLEHFEKEKGIRREILIAALEAALVSAARKALGENAGDITVKFNSETGSIKVFSTGKEVASDEFGRIAAQSAKQIIIQKIREAERDVIYEEYLPKVGTITHGTVHRFEKGNIVIDLGKTEAIVPKSEQSSKEQYRQGDRVRAIVLDVKKTSRGPQIILSRAHPDFVKELFELEVPEIYENIVQIKSVSREAGDRTKLAVYSKDEKIDSVGACVGMRGMRVKNIVRELQGEKIDIVRWNEDTKEFIMSALSPAKVSGVSVNEENKKAEVVVEDDQLSLAIGKKGQNVRLAARLVGYDIDIRSRSMLAQKVLVAQIKAVGPKTRKALEEAGYKTVDTIAAATVDALTKIESIGKRTAEKVIENAKELLRGEKHTKPQKPEIKLLEPAKEAKKEEKEKPKKQKPKKEKTKKAKPRKKKKDK
ncbi:MAG: transcription termination factor NusA [Candidatus Omnitrophota bacterium]